MSPFSVRKTCAAFALSGLLLPTYALAQQAGQAIADTPVDDSTQVAVAPPSNQTTMGHVKSLASEPHLTEAQKLLLLQKKVKYVFVLFQENRSFDFYFGTYPGANGLFSQSAAATPGFNQPIVNTDGTIGKISPFKIPQSITATGSGSTVLLYPEDTDSVNHAQTAIDAKLALNANHVAQNNRYAFVEEALTGKLNAAGTVYTGPAPTEQQHQMGELVMSHVDCDTVPLLWNYADRFTLFDNFFDTVIGPSTPNAIAMIAGQSGLTQWVEHPQLALNVDTNNSQVPIVSDPQPYWGSALDVFTPAKDKQPVDNPGGVSANPASNQTYATLPLSFMGNKIEQTTEQDLNPTFDLMDIKEDIQKIAGDGNKPVNWGWYQEGYDHEPTDTTTAASNLDYIAHHNAPQYFGYVADNPVESQSHLKGLGDFYTAINANALPTGGGVFYVRGGYGNLDGLVPRSPSPAVKAAYKGNDDHPGYSDAQISEALVADSVNAIANSKYWAESAIIITYDETDGLFDHTQPKVRTFDPIGNAVDQGPRIPAIVISPFSRAHVISHEATEHGSIIKFIDLLFNLTPLADLPDEAAARKLGKQKYQQDYLGPSDAHTPGVGNLFSAFDNGRLTGSTPPLEASYAITPKSTVTTLPQAAGLGCRVLQITPTDMVDGKVIDPPPADFNPRPGTNPGVPATTAGWPNN